MDGLLIFHIYFHRTLPDIKIFFFAFIMALMVAMIGSIDIPGNFELKLLGSILKVFPISCVLTYMCIYLNMTLKIF